ncbi:unnamed protein product, partial [Rotaria sp. Silwood2]
AGGVQQLFLSLTQFRKKS